MIHKEIFTKLDQKNEIDIHNLPHVYKYIHLCATFIYICSFMNCHPTILIELWGTTGLYLQMFDMALHTHSCLSVNVAIGLYMIFIYDNFRVDP
jgi:hypothetical protein